MKLNYNKGAIPLYLQIYEILKLKIESFEYAYGTLIPSELELEKMYKVSRITIRQAIAQLEKEGYVRRARGKGTSVTYVKRIDESLSAIRSFTTEMKERGLVPGTSFIEVAKEKANDDVAKHLEINEGDEVFCLYRVRTADDEPLVIFETYLSGDYDFPLEKERYMSAMYDVFEEIGVKIPVRVRENFQAILADQHMANMLDVKIGSPIFKRSRIAYNNENKAIEYTISYYRGDRYSYSIELRN
ncbi:MAG: GntR family transcriptional regulator [Erysipelotrichia bacterium]|nr:GntR family transcriptional regulator [Erysipelotrichia bacterium]NCC54042.1 GntR family transcriptional regulator [Erysipelotrichia bacterium]